MSSTGSITFAAKVGPEYQQFIDDGGYARPELWLSMGWAVRDEQGWTEETRAHCFEDSVKLTHELKENGQYLAASPLHPVATATSVRVREGKRMVTDGPFRWTRNPMYLGMTLVYVALALGFDSLGAALLLVPVLLIIRSQVIGREERYLEAKFGDDYRSYKASVRRWI